MKSKTGWLLLGFLIIVLLFSCFGVPLLQEAYLYWKFKDVDITSILIEESDLPPGFSKEEVVDIPPDEFWGRNYLQHKRQDILAPNETKVGSVWVYLYSSRNEQFETYQRLSLVETQEGIIPTKLSEFENCEKCSIAATDGFVFVLFARCAGIGYISIDNKYLQDYGIDYLISHARRLDESLKSIACK